MTEPAAPTSKSSLPWIILGLVLVAGLVAVVLLLSPSGESDEEAAEDANKATAQRLQTQGPYRLSADPSATAIPADAEVVLFAKMQQVLRSPILPALKLDHGRIWQRMSFDPRVKSFLEASGIKLEQSKTFSLIVRGLADRPRAPHVVAQWEGTFDANKVTQAFQQALGAKDVEIAGEKTLADDAIALHAGSGLVMGNRPLFDDLLAGKGDFSATTEVKQVMSHLGKQGAITAFARVVPPPKASIPMVPIEKIAWVGATLEVMGAPKIRLVALTKSSDDAEELAAGVESALGIASLGLGAKGGSDALVDLIELIKVEAKDKVVKVSVDVPLSKLPELVGTFSSPR